MRKAFFRMVALGTIVLFSSLAHAQNDAHLYPVPLSERIQQAQLIAEGKVLSQYSFWDEGHRNIYTSHLVKVFRYFKGELAADEIEVVTQGGTVGLNMETHSSALTLGVGQAGLFFCTPNPVKGSKRKIRTGASYVIYSGQQGFIEYDLTEKKAVEPFRVYPNIEDAVKEIKGKTGKEHRLSENTDLRKTTTLNNRVLAAPSITSFSPTSISAGTSSVLTITGNGFNATRGSGYVEFRNSNNGASGWMQPLSTDYVSWTDTEIKVMVPSTGSGTAGTGQIRVTNSDPSTITSTGTLTVTYAYTNVEYNSVAYKPELIGTNGANGYTFRFNTSFAANAAAGAAFDRAMDSWSCATGMNWRLGSNTAIANATNDGVNVVAFSSTMGAGTLASATSYYSGCINGSGNVFWSVSEIDIQFNSTHTWNYTTANAAGSEKDFESVAVHELGHAHQLTHIVSSGFVMHYAIGSATTVRTLSANDIAGGNAVMTRSLAASSATTCGLTATSTITCSFALPVVLEDFRGATHSNNNTLTWRTSGEHQLKEYQVQASYNNNAFRTVKTVEPKGGLSGESTYEARDINLSGGTYAYRLKMVNEDGSFTYSKTVSLRVGFPAKVFVAGNLAGNTITVNLPERTGHTSLRLMDAMGRVVLQRSIAASEPNIVTLSINQNLPKGLYLLETTISKERFVHKLMKE